MAKNNKVNMPSGMGGLVRYFDEYQSKIQFSPGQIIVMIVVVIIIIIFLEYYGARFLP